MKAITLLVVCCLAILGRAEPEPKNCYAWDGSSSGNFPCDPEAEVSACCGPGSVCMTNLYCTSQFNTSLVGCCTDRSWKSEACPYRLELDGIIDPLTQHFSYANNVTICDDSSVCPGPQNQTCCNENQGRSEINFHNSATLPSNKKGLPSYYAEGGYTIPGSSATVDVNVNAAQSTSVVRSTTSSTSNPTQALAAATSGPSRPDMQATQSSSGLSTGAKAGIGAAVGITAMLCLTAILIFWMRRRRRSHNESNGVSKTPSYRSNGHHWPWAGGHDAKAPVVWSPELGSDSAKYEVDASLESQPYSPHELDGGGVMRKH